MRERFRSLLRFLESPRFATWLLVILGVWSIVGTIVPQGDPAVSAVAAWDASIGFLAPVVALLGLHHAFGAPVFDTVAALLALSTALCAWRRTRVAVQKGRTLREARALDAASLAERHHLRIAVEGGRSSSEALDTAAHALSELGVKTSRRGDVVRSVSPAWSVWGSPLFHWGLVAILLAIVIGVLTRSEGLMGVPVGSSLADAPASYGVLHRGPLHLWASHRSIRVDDFKTSYSAGGIDRGPTPLVSVLGADGRVVKTSPVYPNSPLQVGSLTIHPSAWGFAVNASLVATSGTVYGHATRLVDTSEGTSEGTVPLGDLAFTDASRQTAGHIVLTVPLDRKADWSLLVPAALQAHVVVTDASGAVRADAVVPPGGSIALPTGYLLRIDGVGYYARLMVVDDLTIPFLYAAMALAVLGLTLSLVSRQQAIVMTALDEADGVAVYASVRLWRNVSTSREEIEQQLAKALRRDDDEEGAA